MVGGNREGAAGVGRSAALGVNREGAGLHNFFASLRMTKSFYRNLPMLFLVLICQLWRTLFLLYPHKTNIF